MMVLPSVGSTVTKILLNKSATKAQITFDDGSVCVIATDTCKNSGTQQLPKPVMKKKVLHSESKRPMGMPKVTKTGVKNVQTRSGTFVVETKSPEELEAAKAKILARSEKRIAMLEKAAMTPSERAGLQQVAEAERNGTLM